jgi:hypothetical protein
LIGEEDGEHNSGAQIAKKDEGSPSGGGDELAIIDCLPRIQVGKYLGPFTRNFPRIWNYPSPPFEASPLHICNQEYRKTNSEVIGAGGEEEEIREDISDGEGKVNATSPRRVSVERILTTNILMRGVGQRVTMASSG